MESSRTGPCPAGPFTLQRPEALKKELRLLLPLAALLGAVCYLLVFGFSPLNVTRDGWLMGGGDLTQHYLGWRMFRAGAWQFPLGLTDTLTYPYATSVLYADSIPLLALPFKALSALLPATFQYFGLWGLLCCMLSGVFGALCLRALLPRWPLCLACSVLFIVAPPMLYRLYMHTSLAAHWLVLAAFALWFYGGLLGPKRRVALWTLLMALAAATHPYFIPMVGMVLLAAVLQQAIATKRVAVNALTLAAPLLAGLTMLWLLGAFAGGVSAEMGGLGEYSFNLLGFFSGTFSLVLPALPSLSGQYEGMAYLGLGLILGGCVAVAACAVRLWQKQRTGLLRQSLAAQPTGPYWLAGLAAVSIAVALSPVVTLGGRVLFTLPYPGFLLRIMGVFRATGRLVWPAWYALCFLVLWLLAKALRGRAAVAGILLLAAVQVADLFPLYARSRQRTENEALPGLATAAWQALAQDTQHLVVDERHKGSAQQFRLVAFAADNGMTVSDFYLARSNENVAESWARALLQAAGEGLAPDTALIMYEESNALLLSWLLDGADIAAADGYWLYTTAPLPGDGVAYTESGLDILTLFNVGLIDVEWEEEELRIRPGGQLFGPYASLPAGSYRLRIEGEGLSAQACSVVAPRMEQVGQQARQEEEGTVVVEFTLAEALHGIEFYVLAPEGGATVTGMWLYKA